MPLRCYVASSPPGRAGLCVVVAWFGYRGAVFALFRAVTYSCIAFHLAFSLRRCADHDDVPQCALNTQTGVPA
ncbi:hypothetical protein BTO02_11960 [Paraburkholderia sp. SOS3]|nr:hypothetical protein BTO02_11960 [Paraburkholderia sp. SOS3]